MSVKTKRGTFVPHARNFCRRPLRLGLALALSGALLACRAQPSGTATAGILLMQLERTACMGPCPVDVLTVYADGQMRYEGKANAPRQGTFSARLSRREQTELVQAFEAAQFFNFAPAYVSQRSDLPTYFLTYARADRRLKITDYDGAPPALKALEARLEALVETARWQRQ